MAQLRDLLLTGIAFGLPAYFVFRSTRFGVPLGAAMLWLLIFLCGEISATWSFSPPMDNRAAALEDWLLAGWVYGLVYCSLVWLLKQSLFMLRRALFIYHQQIDCSLTPIPRFLQIWRELNQPSAAQPSQPHPSSPT